MIDDLINKGSPPGYAAEDTVHVSGSATWSKQLILTKGVRLLGAGATSTVITSAYQASSTNTTDPGSTLIFYKPGSPKNDEAFEISGFTFDMQDKCGFLFAKNGASPAMYKNRIHHNVIKNTLYGGRTINVTGAFYGVIHSNTFIKVGSAIAAYGNNVSSWTSLTFSFGTLDNIYFEDNVFQDLKGTPHSCGAGGRYAARYNTYTTNAGKGLYPWFDAHGNQVGGNLATMGVEIYGNRLDHAYPTAGVGLVDQRGGMAVVFGNSIMATAGASAKVREEYDDALNPPAAGPAGQPQHVSFSYHFNNRRNHTKNIKTVIATTSAWENGLVENVDFWNLNPAYNGKIAFGIFCGAALPKNCKEGDGAWITTQSCTSAPDKHTGADPKEPIQGTLYRCGKGNSWAVIFTPLPYPHPLRTGGGPDGGVPDGGLDAGAPDGSKGDGSVVPDGGGVPDGGVQDGAPSADAGPEKGDEGCSAACRVGGGAPGPPLWLLGLLALLLLLDRRRG